MEELYTSTDPVEISYLKLRLEQAGLKIFCLDNHTSLMEGSLGILPTRIMVAQEYYHDAKQLLAALLAEADQAPGINDDEQST